MISPPKRIPIERLIEPLGECLTVESAKALVALKADPQVQQYMDELASRHTEGALDPAEREEYGNFVSFATFVAILKSMARQKLASRAKKDG